MQVGTPTSERVRYGNSTAKRGQIGWNQHYTGSYLEFVWIVFSVVSLTINTSNLLIVYYTFGVACIYCQTGR